ncbi:hypothetical protein AX16_004854 [Volvariella volvacea WC 439]|nr:hypothetical protein AX16_004854 [Volvariella volvacea WC 439]
MGSTVSKKFKRNKNTKTFPVTFGGAQAPPFVPYPYAAGGPGGAQPPQAYPNGMIPFPQPYVPGVMPQAGKTQGRKKKRRKQADTQQDALAQGIFPPGFQPQALVPAPVQDGNIAGAPPPVAVSAASRPPPLFTPVTGSQLRTFPVSPQMGQAPSAGGAAPAAAGAGVIPEPMRRTQTPFIPNTGNTSSESDDSQRQHEMLRAMNSATPFPTTTPVIPASRPTPTPAPAPAPQPQPQPPPPPPTRTPTIPRAHNPLPAPPQDVLSSTPFREVVKLPQTEALLAGSRTGEATTLPDPLPSTSFQPAVQHVITATESNVRTSGGQSRKGKGKDKGKGKSSGGGGLFRGLGSTRRKEEEEEEQEEEQPAAAGGNIVETGVRVVPVYVQVPPQPMMFDSSAGGATPAGLAGVGAGSNSQRHSRMRSESGSVSGGRHGGGHGYQRSDYGHSPPVIPGGAQAQHQPSRQRTPQQNVQNVYQRPYSRSRSRAHSDSDSSSRSESGDEGDHDDEGSSSSSESVSTHPTSYQPHPSQYSHPTTAAGNSNPHSRSHSFSHQQYPTRSSPSSHSHHQQQPVILFTQQGEYSGFMNHSPHEILYQDKWYPSAAHLWEALKFLDRRPDLAERVRTCGVVGGEGGGVTRLDFAEFYRTVANEPFVSQQRPDWSIVFLKALEEVVYMKFTQHPELRAQLLSTGNAKLVYSDERDGYWGSGAMGDGTNHHGRILQMVRDRLRAGYSPGSGRS